MVKRLLRSFVYTTLALLGTVGILSPSFTIHGDYQTFLLSSGILTLLLIGFKPILKVLLFPLSILTLGLFTLVINVIVFFVFLILVPQANLTPWTFPGFSGGGIVIPSQPLNYWLTVLVASACISLITNALSYLAD